MGDRLFVDVVRDKGADLVSCRRNKNNDTEKLPPGNYKNLFLSAFGNMPGNGFSQAIINPRL